MTDHSFNTGLLEFLDRSPTPYHAAKNISDLLRAAGFVELDEASVWHDDMRGRYFVLRGDSSLIAFSLGSDAVADTGLQMVGSHTDSPCLKLKPNAAYEAHGYRQLGVEVYGGALLNPWFDRDLSLAGRVSLRRDDGSLVQRLIDFQRPIAIIPSLAIHLDREANESRAINKQTYLPAVICMASTPFDLNAEIVGVLAKDEPDLAGSTVLAADLSLYPIEPARLIGLRDKFIASARLDNLLSCYVSARALIDVTSERNCLIVCNDHEEVGSGSAIGARGTFLRSVVERLAGSNENFARAVANSYLVSADNAHGIHPNFADRHDQQHGPLLNGGPAIKFNSEQAYASNSETAARFKQVCVAAGVEVQDFVSRTDMRCGSTIGPLTATTLGVKTVDVGVPTFAMHSTRELAGSEDAHALYRALSELFRS